MQLNILRRQKSGPIVTSGLRQKLRYRSHNSATLQSPRQRSFNYFAYPITFILAVLFRR